MLALIQKWQELLGAVIGGLLGVTGAMIVARDAFSRERRNAVRVLQHDLVAVVAVVSGLTSQRSLSPDAIGAPKLAADLKYFRHQLSPLFDAQAAVLAGGDARIVSLLSGFRDGYAAIVAHARTVSSEAPGTVDHTRASGQLVQMVTLTDECAQAALYLLSLHELGTIRRLRERVRRRYFQSEHDRRMQALVKRRLHES